MSELIAMPGSDQALALEYVLGTLRGAERRAFAKKLAATPQLQDMVAAWEETLMALPAPSPVLSPADTWPKIEAQLSPLRKPAINGWLLRGRWVAGIAAVCVLALAVWFFPLQTSSPPAWRASYVAVLTDETGQVQLTALTQSQGEPPNAKNQLRLQGQQAGTRQVWAVSGKDGSVQSLAIVEGTLSEPLVLTKAQWLMIKEAKELLLTEQSSDGQPGRILAKGPCVQLAVVKSVAPAPG